MEEWMAYNHSMPEAHMSYRWTENYEGIIKNKYKRESETGLCGFSKNSNQLVGVRQNNFV